MSIFDFFKKQYVMQEELVQQFKIFKSVARSFGRRLPTSARGHCAAA